MRPRWIVAAPMVAVLGWIAMSGVGPGARRAGRRRRRSTGSRSSRRRRRSSSSSPVQIQSLGGGTAVVVSEAGAPGPAVVSTGDAVVDGTFVRQALEPDLPDGEYLVAYRVISSDGHEVEGSTRFFVGPVPAELDDAAARCTVRVRRTRRARRRAGRGRARRRRSSWSSWSPGWSSGAAASDANRRDHHVGRGRPRTPPGRPPASRGSAAPRS